MTTRQSPNRTDMITLRPACETQPVVTLQAMTPESAAILSQHFAVMDPWLRYAMEAPALAAYLTRPEQSAPRFEIHVGGTLAGAAGIRENWLRGSYLQFLGLLPAFQRQGLGELVLAWFEGAARARSDRNLWVAAAEFNHGALRFYERHGFRRAALLEDLVQDGFTEVLFRKKL